MINQKYLEEKLKAHGYKLTNQRKAIMDILLRSQNRFLSAEEIYLKSKELCTQTNFSTIYRNLELLEKIHMIHKTSIKEGVFSYGLIIDDSHHHHAICKGCGKTETIDFCPLAEAKQKLKQQSFTLTDHKFELYGYCTKCQKET